MRTRNLILTGLFAALTAVGALIIIPLPFSPVPITMQIFFTLLAGIILGSKYGALSQLVYLLIGGIGLPVFAGGGAGFQNLVGPTSGFLWGFVLAAFIIGLISETRSTSLGVDIFAMALGLVLIYSLGVLSLHLVAGYTFLQAFMIGVLPFVIGDILKLVVAAILKQQLVKRIPFLFEKID